MRAIVLAALLPQLGIATLEPIIPATTTPQTAIFTRCPVPSWIGPCHHMTPEQKGQILRALELHPIRGSTPCMAARDALVLWLSTGQPAWVFANHVDDNPGRADYVLGETARSKATKLPVGIGLRDTTFDPASPLTLARVALHEGAHLAGRDEEGARRVHSTCIAAR